jgi:hypothetical protein
MVSITPARYTLRKRAPGTHCIRGLIGPRTDLDYIEVRQLLILPELELPTLDSPASNQWSKVAPVLD